MASSSPSEKNFRLDDTRSVRVNEYKGHVYFHFYDSRKAKSCTLSYESFKKLLLRGNKILDFARKIRPQKDEGKQKDEVKQKDEEKQKRKNKEVELSDVESMDSIDFSD